MAKLKILVTGGAGMIGLEVCKQLAKTEHEVRLFDLGEQIERVKEYIPSNVKIFYGSIVDISSLREIMKDCDIVIHLAALLGVKRSEVNKLKCLEINIDGTKKVLDSAIQQKVKKIVFASSSEVYGEPLKNPIKESDITQGKTVYAVSKLVGEELLKAYNQQYPIEYSILRYFNCYGPFQNAQFVVPKFIKSVMDGTDPQIYGQGKQVRSYTYVEDTASATILAALSDAANGQVLNIGSSNQPISLIDLANLVIKIGKKEGKLKPQCSGDFAGTDRSADREIFERYCDASKVKKVLKWESAISLEAGIKKVFDTGILFDRWVGLDDEF